MVAISAETRPSRGRLLLVDDEPALLRACQRLFERQGYEVRTAVDGGAAAGLLHASDFDAVLTDIRMPMMNGLQLLTAIKRHDRDLPVILMTAAPALDTAIAAIEQGALRYVTKPVDFPRLMDVVAGAVQERRERQTRRQNAISLAQVAIERDRDLDRGISRLWMAYQPIVRRGELVAYEALMRSEHLALPHPGALLDAAEKSGRLHDLGRAVRERVAFDTASVPHQVFVNLHAHDLLDDQLFAPSAPLSQLASRVVLELTERAALEEVPDLAERVQSLRGLGYRLAVDDLGAGYAGLTTFAQIAPEVVKLDMAMVRGVDKDPTKQRVVRAVADLCRELSAMLVCEGVETAAERDTLLRLGCDVHQGYLYGKPARPFVTPSF